MYIRYLYNIYNIYIIYIRYLYNIYKTLRNYSDYCRPGSVNARIIESIALWPIYTSLSVYLDSFASEETQMRKRQM